MTSASVTRTAGGSTAFSTATQAVDQVVTAVNDKPQRTAGMLAGVSVVEGSGPESLNLAAIDYRPGGGADEAGQVLTYKVTAVPSSGFGKVVLADGATAVTANTAYTLAEIRGMQFDAGNTSSGTGSFSFEVKDDGGTAGGGDDTLSQTVSLTIVNQAPVLSGAKDLLWIDEDEVSADGLLVADLVKDKISDPLNVLGIAVVAAASPDGTWQYTRDQGASWNDFTGVSESNAVLLGPDWLTRVRFVPNADWNGTASGLTFRAWDQSGATMGELTADARATGGSSPFSADTATATSAADSPSPVAAPDEDARAAAALAESVGITRLAGFLAGGMTSWREERRPATPAAVGRRAAPPSPRGRRGAAPSRRASRAR